MNTNKLLIGALLGGVAYFLLGWVIYGMLLQGTMSSLNPNADAIMKSDDEMDMVALIIGNLVAGLLLAYIFEKWANIRSFTGGMVAGATVGFLVALGYDAVMLGTTTLLTWGGVIVDALAYAVMSAFAGGVIGWWLGYNRA